MYWNIQLYKGKWNDDDEMRKLVYKIIESLQQHVLLTRYLVAPEMGVLEM